MDLAVLLVCERVQEVVKLILEGKYHGYLTGFFFFLLTCLNVAGVLLLVTETFLNYPSRGVVLL